jgi:hypothetical protein
MIKKDSNIIVLLFFAIILAIFGPVSVNIRASEGVTGAMFISLETKNKPLKSVLNDITQKTGYTFTVDSRWQNLPVTVSLNNVALHQALRVILKDFTIAIIQDNPRQKHIAIIIGDIVSSHTGSLNIDAEGGYPNPIVPENAHDSIRQEKEADDPLDMEVLPPDQPGGKGVTLRELQNAESRDEEKEADDPLDMEVIPPDQPGGKGVTLRELQNAESRDEEKNTDDPLDMEVIPPDQPGGKGVTLRELQTAESGSEENLNNIEVIPPEKPGERGISQREIEQIRTRQKSKELKPKSPVPIDNQ